MFDFLSDEIDNKLYHICICPSNEKNHMSKEMKSETVLYV